MDHKKYPISVVPYPIDKTSSMNRTAPEESEDWDAKWLRPKITTMPLKIEKMAAPRQHETPRQQLTPRPREQEEEMPKLPVYLRFLHWLFPEVNMRRAKRFPTPGLVAYYWTGGAPYSYNVGDMSATGLFLLTKEKWAPGTLIQMTLQQQDGRTAAENSICVLSEVVRWGENGAGFNFILSDYENVQQYGILPGAAVDRKSVERFLHKIGTPVAR